MSDSVVVTTTPSPLGERPAISYEIRAIRTRTRAMKAARAAGFERSRSYCARKPGRPQPI
jgi:hypothetical protein